MSLIVSSLVPGARPQTIRHQHSHHFVVPGRAHFRTEQDPSRNGQKVAPPLRSEYGRKPNSSKPVARSTSLNACRHLEGEGHSESRSGQSRIQAWSQRRGSSTVMVMLSEAPWRLPALVKPKEITAGPLTLVRLTSEEQRLRISPVRKVP